MSVVDSIMQCAGSDKLAGDAWKTLVISTKDVPSAALDTVLENAETEFKERTGHTKLPGRWRSAKSVLIKARVHSVELVSGDVVMGKSAVEKACKALSPDAYESPTDTVAKYWALLKRALKQEPNETIRAAMIVTIKQELDRLC